jgi:hypothetical protein
MAAKSGHETAIKNNPRVRVTLTVGSTDFIIGLEIRSPRNRRDPAEQGIQRAPNSGSWTHTFATKPPGGGSYKVIVLFIESGSDVNAGLEIEEASLDLAYVEMQQHKIPC